MSFSFTVDAAELPPFSDLVAAAHLAPRPELKGAGATAAGWPQGLIQKIPDASNGPSKLELTPSFEAILARMGLSASFVAWSRGQSTRGVEVTRQRSGVRFRVCMLATAADYQLAAQLAATTARITKSLVHAEHGPDGRAVEPLEPDAFLALFDRAFFEKNAREMSEAMLAEIAAGATWYFTVGTDWLALGPAHLAGTPVEQRLEKARAVLAAPRAAAPAPIDEERREAVLITSAMLTAVLADGKIEPEEARLVEAQLLTVPGLSRHDATQLMVDAKQPEGTLGELSLSARKKAFVLAAELLACTRGGMVKAPGGDDVGRMAAGDTTEPNVKAAMTLAAALGLESNEPFLVDVGACVAAKYFPEAVSRDSSRTFVEAMLLAAAADGVISDAEQAVIAALARTVPQLQLPDFPELLKEAQARIALGLPVVAADLRALPKFKNKCWLLACEVALCTGGREADNAMLGQLRDWITPADAFAPRPMIALGAKYSSREADARSAVARLLAGPVRKAETAAPLRPIAERALTEGTNFVLADTYYFAALVTERAGVFETHVSPQAFLPESVNELKAWLAGNLAGVERYALTWPGLSFSAGGSVVVCEAGDRSSPQGLRLERRYQPKTPQAPALLVGEAVAGNSCESLLYEPPAEGALRFTIAPAPKGAWVTYACRAGEQPFELSMKLGTRSAQGVQLADGRLKFSAAAAKALLGLEAEIDANASVVVLSANALREANGFASRGGSWLCSKWTVNGRELYVNLQPDFLRGELKPKESSLAAALG